MDLRFHGDRELSRGLVDLAVNVRTAPMPDWLAEPIAASLANLARYPDLAPARAAIAARHGRPAEEVLLTAGASEAFTLLARLASTALVVHPQYTEPEAALRACGARVDRHVLRADNGFRLDVGSVPHDFLVLGNPTNPTSVLHPADDVARLTGTGRLVVVDEAFADTVPGEPASLASRRDLPGLVVVRSLTKTWGLAGLRVGYLLAPASVVSSLAPYVPPWNVSTPALAAMLACATAEAVAAERAIAVALASERGYLVTALRRVPDVAIVGEPASSFVLIRVVDGERVRLALRERGYAVRRGDTFPGLGADWLRVAVRDTATTDAFVRALTEVMEAAHVG